MSGDGPVRPDPGGRDDGDDAASERSDLAVLVPDDARELDGDRLALLTELRQRAATQPSLSNADRALSRREVVGSRVRRLGTTGWLLLVVLLLVGVAGTLVSVFAPRAPLPLERLPLASGADAAPGQIGGLLPEAEVSVGLRHGDVRAIRPAVLVVVPPSCLDCADAIFNVSSQAREYTLALALVGTPDQQDQLRELDRAGAGGGAIQLIDPDGVLGSTYALTTTVPTLVLVHADGVVGAVASADPDTRYESALVQLPRPGASQ
ncbi:MAG: hypothetical protein ABWZ26_05005 [Candidatus Nanopelagicales bacterium]